FHFEFDCEFDFLFQCEFDFEFDYEFDFRFQSPRTISSSTKKVPADPCETWVPYSRIGYEERVEAIYPMDFDDPISLTAPREILELHSMVMNVPPSKWDKRMFLGNVDIVDPDTGLSPLMVACFGKNFAAAKALLELGADPNFDRHGITFIGLKYSNITPLHVAARLGTPDLIELLIQNGANVNQQCSPQGNTPLHSAIVGKHVDAIAALGKHPNLDLSLPRFDGQCPLHVAIHSCSVLKAVLKLKNVDVNVRETSEKLTALHLATFYEKIRSVKILIQHGADVNAEVVSGHTALDLAYFKGYLGEIAVVSMLKRAGGVRKKTDEAVERWLPWMFAIRLGPISMKRKILYGFSKIDYPTFGGGTALHHMTLQDQLEGCRFLLMRGAKVDTQDHYGNTPLQLAASIANSEIMELLLDYGADINTRSFLGGTPLYNAVQSSSYSAVKFLLTKGADVSFVINGEDLSLLFFAVQRRYPVILDVLLKHGMDPNRRISTKRGCNMTVFCLAAIDNQPDMIKMLADCGADVNAPALFDSNTQKLHPLQFVAYHKKATLDTVRALVDVGSYIDAEPMNHECKTLRSMGLKNLHMNLYRSMENEAGVFCLQTNLLFDAVRRNDVKKAEQYFKSGAAVNCRSEKFTTPLVYAAWKGYTAMVRFLLDRGARVNEFGPLIYAAKSNHEEIVIELLGRGADIKKRIEGKTALDVAKEKNNVRISSILTVVERWLEKFGQ
ncbi:unnamed protein product, partial [Nesidiocoris tenuis]